MGAHGAQRPDVALQNALSLFARHRSADVFSRPFLGSLDVGEPQPSPEGVHLASVRLRDTA
jgi:hypothetical protein